MYSFAVSAGEAVIFKKIIGFMIFLTYGMLFVSVFVLSPRGSRAVNPTIQSLKSSPFYLPVLILVVAALSDPAVQSANLFLLKWRAQPIIEAIDKYEQERGAPPSTLEELVPNYLTILPDTGMGAAPFFFFDLQYLEPNGERSSPISGTPYRVLSSRGPLREQVFRKYPTKERSILDDRPREILYGSR